MLSRNTDILLSYDTDIEFGSQDLLLSSGQDLIKRKIHKMLITEPGDWKIHTTVGANPSIFIGEPNNRDTANRLRDHLIFRLQPFVNPLSVDVRVITINYESVKVYIDIYTMEDIVTASSFSLDFINGITYSQFDEVVDKIIYSGTLKSNSINNINNPNPYLDKLRLQ
jgi:hypothetical protein